MSEEAEPRTVPRTQQVLQRGLSILGTVVAVIVTGFMGMVCSVLPTAITTGWQTTWHNFGVVVAIFAAITLIWRQKYPLLVLLISVALVVLFPLSPFGPAITLTWFLASCNNRQMAWGLPLSAAAIALPFWRDYRTPVEAAVMSVGPSGGPKEALDFGSYLLWFAAFLVTSVAIGLARRWRLKAVASQSDAQATRDRERWLSEELSRREEREAIAQEIHDTVAHQLSLVSLHAGALEMTATDPVVPEAAQAMRTHAHTALEELRSVIKALRSSDEGYTGDPPSFASIQGLIDGLEEAGKSVKAHIQIPDDAESASPSLKRATYRIVQESLTNAVKHAPDSGVGVNVVVEPGNGVSMSVTNWLGIPMDAESRFSPSSANETTQPGSSKSVPSARAGLLGMSERSHALGGRITAGPDGDRWVVRAWLPWVND